MTDYEMYRVARLRLETVWREAERRTRLLAAAGDASEDAETALSRAGGARV